MLQLFNAQFGIRRGLRIAKRSADRLLHHPTLNHPTILNILALCT